MSEVMSDYVFLNERLVEAGAAVVSVHDAGLLHGVGLFETVRCYGGRCFRLGDHIERLFGSAKVLGITVEQSRSDLAGWVEALIEANGIADGRVRVTLTRGDVRKAMEEGRPQSTLFITAGTMEGYAADFYKRGMTVIVSSYRQNLGDPLVGHKTTNYFARLLGLQEAQAKQAGEALWFTLDGKLAGGSVSNVFVVQGEKVVTPPLETPVLAGVTRQVVLELADELGIETEQRTLVWEEVKEASEVFLTNSIMELMPVCREERRPIGEGKPGPVYERLRQAYRQAVEKACGGE